MRGKCIIIPLPESKCKLGGFYEILLLHNTTYAFLPPVIKGSCFQNVQGLTVFKLIFSFMLKSNERNVYIFHLPESKCKLGGFYEVLLLHYTNHAFLPPIIKGSCFQNVRGLRWPVPIYMRVGYVFDSRFSEWKIQPISTIFCILNHVLINNDGTLRKCCSFSNRYKNFWDVGIYLKPHFYEKWK